MVWELRGALLFQFVSNRHVTTLFQCVLELRVQLTACQNIRCLQCEGPILGQAERDGGKNAVLFPTTGLFEVTSLQSIW